MTLDARMRSLATNLLQSYGKSVTFKRITQGAYNTDTGSVATTIANTPIHIIMQNPNNAELATGQYRIDQVIAMISAEELGFAPTPNDKLTIDGNDWNITSVSFICSGEQNAVYNCVINK